MRSPVTGCSSAPFRAAPRSDRRWLQKPTPRTETIAPSDCQSLVVGRPHSTLNSLNADAMSSRARDVFERQSGVGMTALRYDSWSVQLQPDPTSLEAELGDLRHDLPGLALKGRSPQPSAADAGTDACRSRRSSVPVGSSWTALLPRSLSVFMRHNSPPQRAGVGQAASRPAAAAASAVAARQHQGGGCRKLHHVLAARDRTPFGQETSTLEPPAGVAELVNAPGLGPGGADAP